MLHNQVKTSWVAVKELELSYHNGYIYICIHSNNGAFPNIVIEIKFLNNSNPGDVKLFDPPLSASFSYSSVGRVPHLGLRLDKSEHI